MTRVRVDCVIKLIDKYLATVILMATKRFPTTRCIIPPTKKPKYQCTYQTSWEEEVSGIKKRTKGDSFVICVYCDEHFSTAHGGKNDMKRHVEQQKHIDNVHSARQSGIQSRLTDNRAGGPSQTFADLVMKAEVLFVQIIAEHNLSFSVGDHLTRLVKKAFPDSKVAEKIHCGHTKMSTIMNKTLGPHYMDRFLPAAQEGPVTIMMDESSKRSDDEVCDIHVRMVDSITFQVVNRFLGMPICNIHTGENLLSVLEATLSQNNIKWDSVKGFSSDTARAMVGV